MKKFTIFFIFFYFIFNIEGKGNDEFDIVKLDCLSKYKKEDPWTRNYYKKNNIKQTYDQEEFVIEKRINTSNEEISFCISFANRLKCLDGTYKDKVSYEYKPWEYNTLGLSEDAFNQLKTMKVKFTYYIVDKNYYKKTSRWNDYYNYLWHVEERGSCD